MAGADVIVDAAPLFEERFALNRAAVRQRKPLVECAVYAMDVQVTAVIPGRTACLECIVPEKPPEWKRQFPVLGAVSGVAGCIGAVEVVKLLTGIGKPLTGVQLVMDLDTLHIRQLKVMRRVNCAVCGGVD